MSELSAYLVRGWQADKSLAYLEPREAGPNRRTIAQDWDWRSERVRRLAPLQLWLDLQSAKRPTSCLTELLVSTVYARETSCTSRLAY
jgi:hypothetical protein